MNCISGQEKTIILVRNAHSKQVPTFPEPSWGCSIGAQEDPFHTLGSREAVFFL